MALQYYDLCDEIIHAKPSPLLDYPEHELKQFVDTYNLNSAQAKAVRSALDNDAFTLIQGPPGSGKTKTICALVGADAVEKRRLAIIWTHGPRQWPIVVEVKCLHSHRRFSCVHQVMLPSMSWCCVSKRASQ